jgi:hypothetical protein
MGWKLHFLLGTIFCRFNTRHTDSGIITAALMVVPPVAKLQQQKLDKRTTNFTKKDEA